MFQMPVDRFPRHISGSGTDSNQLHRCQYCHEKFTHRKELLTHMQTRHVMPSIACGICNKMFTKQNTLRLHMQEHSHQYTCHMCGKTFSQKHHYTGHMNSHAGAKPFQCKKCLKCFGYSSNLARHVKHCNVLMT